MGCHGKCDKYKEYVDKVHREKNMNLEKKKQAKINENGFRYRPKRKEK